MANITKRMLKHSDGADSTHAADVYITAEDGKKQQSDDTQQYSFFMTLDINTKLQKTLRVLVTRAFIDNAPSYKAQVFMNDKSDYVGISDGEFVITSYGETAEEISNNILKELVKFYDRKIVMLSEIKETISNAVVKNDELA